jgi:hypothetical protein
MEVKIEDLEYKLGKHAQQDWGIPGKLHKYIVYFDKPDSLVMYASLEHAKDPYDGQKYKVLHKHIAEDFGLEKKYVLGGGSYKVSDGALALFGFSSGFGGVPSVVKQGLGELLQSEIQEKSGAQLELALHDPSESMCDKWLAKGFPLDFIVSGLEEKEKKWVIQDYQDKQKYSF